MHQVSAELQRRVTQKIDECVATINQHYRTSLPAIKVRYDINARTLLGQALCREAVVRVNPVYLNANIEDYIADTIPHEVAHIGVFVVYGGRRYGVSPHGIEWRNMMRTLGVAPNRCGNHEAPEGVQFGKPKAKYNYTCSCCGEIVTCGPKHHKLLQQGEALYHGKCGKSSRLIFAAAVGRVTYAEAKKQGTTPAPAPVVPARPVAAAKEAPRVGSKIDQCYHWYQHYLNNVPAGWTLRQICISVFMQEVGMSAAGASTYYNTCQKMYNQK